MVSKHQALDFKKLSAGKTAPNKKTYQMLSKFKKTLSNLLQRDDL